MIDTLSYDLSQKLQALVSKPHIVGRFILFGAGRGEPYWLCRGDGVQGVGFTPLEAYEDWEWVRTK